MPLCNQCGKPAVIVISDNPLCVDCNFKFQQSLDSRNRALKELLNLHISSAENITGLPQGTFSRIESPSPVDHYRNVHNQIQIDRSVIGVVNSGSIAVLNISLDEITTQGKDDLAAVLKELVELALASKDLKDELKSDIVEISRFVAEQLANAEPKKHAHVVKSLLSSLKEKVSAVAPVLSALNNLYGIVEKILN